MEDYYPYFISDQISKIRAVLRRKGYYPSRERLVRHLDNSIDVFVDKYAELQERDDLIGNYYEEEEAYDFCIKKDAINFILEEMIAEGITRDEKKITKN